MHTSATHFFSKKLGAAKQNYGREICGFETTPATISQTLSKASDNEEPDDMEFTTEDYYRILDIVRIYRWQTEDFSTYRVCILICGIMTECRNPQHNARADAKDSMNALNREGSPAGLDVMLDGTVHAGQSWLPPSQVVQWVKNTSDTNIGNTRDNQELWLDKYTSSSLVVHKKKVEEVKDWFKTLQFGSFMAINGNTNKVTFSTSNKG
ncbi:hypothetical protein L1987_20120 [Smallanthus sonchifolius]|uniref:Uncharacterized protein n=1 Tax=Smallanthus sonchifolius TaxID=185202 RepID=A0ACB9IQG1_9ASTR|nr:hypothetical protein L1987_20120 [Smallanthus sonchifolius]